MAVSPADIKTLRETTGAGMLDCKKALEENNGDKEAATDWLRKKGLAAAAKKAGRAAAEGLVAISNASTKGAMIELNSETDFVARNEQFQELAKNIVSTAMAGDYGSDIDALKGAKMESGNTVDAEVTNAVGTIGENINLRRCESLVVSKGVVASYVHNSVVPGAGKIGVLVGLESDGDPVALDTLGKQIAMHVAAANPEALSRDELDQSLIERERSVFTEQALASGKPENVVEKMVEGRINKFYGEVVLLEQVFVVDGKEKVGKFVEAKAKEIGSDIKVVAFKCFRLGEGVEKKEDDFAAEVAAAANG